MSLLQISRKPLPPTGESLRAAPAFPILPGGTFLASNLHDGDSENGDSASNSYLHQISLHQADNTMPYFFDSLPIKPLPSSRSRLPVKKGYQQGPTRGCNLSLTTTLLSQTWVRYEHYSELIQLKQPYWKFLDPLELKQIPMTKAPWKLRKNSEKSWYGLLPRLSTFGRCLPTAQRQMPYPPLFSANSCKRVECATWSQLHWIRGTFQIKGRTSVI